MHAFLEFTGNLITKKPEPWNWDASLSEHTELDQAKEAIEFLQHRGVNVAAMVGKYHRHRFMPLMARTLTMWRVGLNDWVMSSAEMAAVGPSALAWPVDGTPMKLHLGYLQLVCSCTFDFLAFHSERSLFPFLRSIPISRRARAQV